jgi:glucan phosphorylase
MIEHYRFWAIARSDDRVVELRRKVDWSRRLVEDGPDAQGQHDRYLRESEQAMPLYNARLQELKNSLGLRPATRILAEARASAHEFVREVPLDVMLTRYRRLDEELAKVEEAAAEALEQHEKWVDIEIEDRKLRDMGAYD